MQWTKKTAYLVWLSLFLRDTAKSKSSPPPRPPHRPPHTFSTGLSGILFSCFWLQKPQMTRKCKHTNTISMYGETFYGRHTAQWQLLLLSKKGILRKNSEHQKFSLLCYSCSFSWTSVTTVFWRFVWHVLLIFFTSSGFLVLFQNPKTVSVKT